MLAGAKSRTRCRPLATWPAARPVEVTAQTTERWREVVMTGATTATVRRTIRSRVLARASAEMCRTIVWLHAVAWFTPLQNLAVSVTVAEMET